MHAARSVTRRAHTLRWAEARVARRPAVLSALAALAALPAAAVAEDDTAEFERLQKEAQKLRQLIENTKSAALPDAPSFNKGNAPVAKAGKEVKLPEEPSVKSGPQVVASEAKRPTPDAARQPKEVIKLLLEALVNNDTPEEDFGLKTVVGFSSSVNPYYSQPPQRFIQAVKNSGYSILLGNYDTASVGKPDQGKGDDGVPFQVFPIKISATNRAFLIAGVDNKYLYDAPDGMCMLCVCVCVCMHARTHTHTHIHTHRHTHIHTHRHIQAVPSASSTGSSRKTPSPKPGFSTLYSPPPNPLSLPYTDLHSLSVCVSTCEQYLPWACICVCVTHTHKHTHTQSVPWALHTRVYPAASHIHARMNTHTQRHTHTHTHNTHTHNTHTHTHTLDLRSISTTFLFVLLWLRCVLTLFFCGACRCIWCLTKRKKPNERDCRCVVTFGLNERAERQKGE